MVNEDFMRQFPMANATFMPYLVSDHSLVVVRIPSIMAKKSKPFRFANFVSDKEEFISTVEKEWRCEEQGVRMYKLVKKMKNLKRHLRKLA